MGSTIIQHNLMLYLGYIAPSDAFFMPNSKLGIGLHEVWMVLELLMGLSLCRIFPYGTVVEHAQGSKCLNIHMML